MTLRIVKSRARSDSGSALRDLREINVLVVHPDNDDGRHLIDQLKRIGCQVRVQWPIPDRAPFNVDVIVLQVSPESISTNTPWLSGNTAPIIPVIAYENPIIIESLLQLGVTTVIPSPVKSFGLLAALVITLAQSKKNREREKHVKRLEGRMSVMRTVQQAKIILMETRGLSEVDAYNALREQAMAKRETVEKIAEALLKAHELYPQNKP